VPACLPACPRPVSRSAVTDPRPFTADRHSAAAADDDADELRLGTTAASSFLLMFTRV